MKYAVVLEKASDGGWGAYPPDLPGVGVVSDTIVAALESVDQAIDMQLEALREAGAEPPPAATQPSQTVDLPHVSGYDVTSESESCR